MVFRYEAPVAGVKGIMAVVAHHPIVVQLEGVGVCLLSVDVDTVRFLFQCIAFISYDATFVNGQVIFVQGNGRTFFLSPDWPVIIPCPLCIEDMRIHLS